MVSNLLKRALCVTAFLLSASLADVSQADPEEAWFAFVPSHLTPEISGDLTLGGPGNTPLDAEAVLDMEGDKTFSGDLEFHSGRHHFRMRGLPFRFDGQSTLAAPVTVLSIPFPAGHVVASELEVNTYRFAYRFDAYESSRFRLSPVVELGYVDADFEIQNLTFPAARVSDDFRSPLPLVGLHAMYAPHQRVRLFAEAAGFRAGSWDDLEDATILDAEIGISVGLNENAWLTAAYRDTDFEFESGITDFDMEMGGMSLRFELRY